MRGIHSVHSTSVAMDGNRTVVHLDPVNHAGGKSVAKSDRSLAVLAGYDEIPIARLDFWHGDHSSIVSICFGGHALDVIPFFDVAGSTRGVTSPLRPRAEKKLSPHEKSRRTSPEHARIRLLTRL